MPLGFTFPYFGRTYTAVTVTANGMMFLEPSSAGNLDADFGANSALPNVAEANAVIAPFWDDLNGRNSNSVVQKQSLTGPYGQGFAVEWKDWNYFLVGAYSLTFQARLWENGLIEFYYGSVSGSGPDLSATVGIEDPTGTVATYGKACSPACKISDFSTNQLIAFGPAAGADLSARSLAIASVVTAGPNLNVSTTLSLLNFGTQAATSFTYRLYLSNNTLYEPGLDEPLTPTPQGPLTIPPLGALAHTATTTAPKPATGSYYVIAVIDDANVVAESNESNNNAATASPLVAGIDLVAESIDGPPLGGPGDSVTNNIAFTNQGLDPAGATQVAVWLSLDAELGAGDIKVHETTMMVAGGQTVSVPLTYALPTTVPAGDYYFILQLDDAPAAGAIAELSEINNLKTSAIRFTAKQADLVVDAVRVTSTLAPYVTAPVAFFGEPTRVEAVVRNAGGASVPSFAVRFYMSDNDTLSGNGDPLMGAVTGLSLAPGQTVVASLNPLVPVNDVGGAPLKTGNYFVFGAAVAVGLTEGNSNNNFVKAPVLKVRTPAADLIPTGIIGPTVSGVGETLVVTRTLANQGIRAATGVKYRYVLSANAIATVDDFPLPVQVGATFVPDATVTLAAGQAQVATDFVKVPAFVPPGSYFLGVILDPEGAVDDVDVSNNGLASQRVEVLGQRLAVVGRLPDATAGVPYDYTLVTQGARTAPVFSLSAGSMAPPGLSLSAAGRLSGTPTTTGVFGMTVKATSAGESAESVLVLRVATQTVTVAILTDALPTPLQDAPYVAPLGVAGGQAPYTWDVERGLLPSGLSLNSEGVLAGVPVGALGAQSVFSLRVRDAIGNADVREFKLTVADPAVLRIVASAIPVGAVGQDYAVDLVASRGAAATSKPLFWDINVGALPPGLALSVVDDKALLSGTPTQAGTFNVTIGVRDGIGRVASFPMQLLIVAKSVSLRGSKIPTEVAVGDVVAARVVPSEAVEGAVFSLHDGRLPPGVVLGADGSLSGAVVEGERGRYTFSVSYSTAASRISVASFSTDYLTVAEARARGCGCVGGVGEASFAAWALLAVGLLRRKRAFS